MKTKIACIACSVSAILFASCEKSGDALHQHRPAVGLQLVDLVKASAAPEYQLEGNTLEAVLVDEKWVLHLSNDEIVSVVDENDLMDALKTVNTENQKAGFNTNLLISAPGRTPFREIAKLCRNAAAMGLGEIFLLTFNDREPLGNHALKLVFPRACACGCGKAPEIEPIVILLETDGRVFFGTGASRMLLDRDIADPTLPGLSHGLAVYASAAKSANSRLYCSLILSKEASYQRAIDVISKMHQYEVEFDMQALLDDPEPIRIESLKRMPKAPSSASVYR